MAQFITAKTQNVTDARTKVMKIIKFLRDHRGPHSIHHIRNKTKIDLQKAENVNVKQSLKQNEKVLARGTTFEYQPTIPGIHNKSMLQLYIQQRPQGVSLEKLEDSYVKAKEHLAKFLADGRVIQFMNSDTKRHMLYWYFGRLRKQPILTERDRERQRKKEGLSEEEADKQEAARLKVAEPEETRDGLVNRDMFPLISDSIIATWNDIKIPPTKAELQRQLEEVSLISSAFSKKRVRAKAAGPKGHQRKKRKMNLSNMNLTNTHLLMDEEQGKKLEADRAKKNPNERVLPTLPKQQKSQ